MKHWEWSFIAPDKMGMVCFMYLAETKWKNGECKRQGAGIVFELNRLSAPAPPPYTRLAWQPFEMVPFPLPPCWNMPPWHSVASTIPPVFLTAAHAACPPVTGASSTFENIMYRGEDLWTGSFAFSGNFSKGSIKATILLPPENNATKPLGGHSNPVYRVAIATIQ